MQEKLNVPIYIPKKSIAEAASPANLSPYRLAIWGERPAFKGLDLPETIEVGQYSWQVIDSPGHHPRHAVFFEKNRGWLFSGDLFIHEKQDVAFKSENMTDTIATIKKILALDFETLFCFHSGIIENGRQRFQHKLDNILKLQSSVSQLRQKGLNSQEINDQLFPRKHIITSVSQGEWSSLNMVKTL